MTDPVLARATIHLPGGLTPGNLYWVDPESDYVQECFEAGYLVPEPQAVSEPWIFVGAADPDSPPFENGWENA